MSHGHEDYVRRIQQDTERYSHELLAENERLRERLAAAEAAHTDLRDALERARAESRRFSQEFVEVQQQNTNLANLYVASYRLHGTLERAEVLATIQEIVANLVGSEEMALFEREESGDGLQLAAWFGIDPDRFRRLAVGQGIIGRVADGGSAHLTQRDGLIGATEDERFLTACIPLKLDARVTGALALFRLLPQKPKLEALDQELFELLAEQAAIALHCAALHAKAGAQCP